MTTEELPSMARPKSDFESPLEEFWGVLDEAKLVTKEGKTGKIFRISEFHFIEVEAIRTTGDAFPYPVAQIDIFYNLRGEKSNWDHYTQSFLSFFGGDETTSVKEIYGKRQRWEKVEVELNQPLKDENGEPILNEKGKQDYGLQKGKAWKIMEIEGLEKGSKSESQLDLAIDLANGRTSQDFIREAVDNEKIRTDATLMTSINDRKFHETMIELKKLSVDSEGVYHKV